MAAGATFYRDAGATDALSDGDWTDPLDFGTVNIPASGDAFTSAVAVYLKNTGTTELQNCSVTAVDGSGQTATVYDDRVEFSADGSTGWATGPYAAGTLAAGAQATIYVRTKASAGDTQPANPVNFSLRVDATSV